MFELVVRGETVVDDTHTPAEGALLLGPQNPTGVRQGIDTATYDDPRRDPTGIPSVVVNGHLAVDPERCTGVLAGQAMP
jgi:hypothetical protein